MRLCVMPWECDPELAHESTVEKLCGQLCVVKFLGKWMGRSMYERRSDDAVGKIG